MKNDETASFSFETLFFVTGFSSFAFIAILKLLDNTYPAFFAWSGIIGTSLGLIIRVIKLLERKFVKKEKIGISHK